MPLLVSGYGYGLGIAAEETAMCCNIPMYGTYLYTEGSGQIDYYFLFGEITEEFWICTVNYRKCTESFSISYSFRKL